MRHLSLSLMCLVLVLGGWAHSVIAEGTSPTNNGQSLEDYLFTDMPMVSVASKTEESQLTAAGTVYVITEEDIKRYGWKNMNEVLQAIPNMDFMWEYNWLNGGQRGFTGNFNGTLLLIDGREVQNLLADETFMANDFPTSRIKRVEVLMGPNSTLYGGNATQGVINIVTKFGDKGDKDVAEVELTGGGGQTEEADGVFKKHGKDWEIGMAGSVFKSGQNWNELAQFASNDDLYSRSPMDQDRYHGTALFQNWAQSWTMDLYGRYAGFYFGYDFFEIMNTAGLEYVKYFYDNNETQRNYGQGYLGYKFNVMDNLSGFVEYQYTQESDNWMLDTADNAGTATSSADLEENIRAEAIPNSTRHRVEGQLDYTGLKDNYFVFGVDWWRVHIDNYLIQQNALTPDLSNSNIEAGWPTDKETVDNSSVYLQDTIQVLDPLKVLLGLRYSKEDYTNDAVLPRASIVYSFNANSVIKLTYGRAFRPPTVFDYLDAAPGVQLDSQVMNMGELNYSQNAVLAGVSVSNVAAAYTMEATDLYSKVYVGGSGGQLSGWQTVVSGGAFKVRGFEDQLKFGITRDLTGFFGFRYALPDATDIDGQYVVANIPVTKENLGVSYDFLNYFTASLFIQHWANTNIEANLYPLQQIGTDQSGNPVYATGVFTVPAWTCLNLNVIAGHLTIDGMKTSLALYIENLLNQPYYEGNVRATTPVEFLQPPRTARVTLSMEF